MPYDLDLIPLKNISGTNGGCIYISNLFDGAATTIRYKNFPEYIKVEYSGSVPNNRSYV